MDKYYAVVYDTWYIGRAIELCDNNTTKFKFLKQSLDKYMWPLTNDIQICQNNFVIYGPINLIGHHPFSVSSKDRNMILKCLKNRTN